ncbi:hypothetical protein D3C74_414460 [compost metagenome]
MIFQHLVRIGGNHPFSRLHDTGIHGLVTDQQLLVEQEKGVRVVTVQRLIQQSHQILCFELDPHNVFNIRGAAGLLDIWID